MTEIEAAYVAQGYELPAGYTWEHVHQARDDWGIREISVPVAVAACGNVCAWGVPMINGKFLTHDAA